MKLSIFWKGCYNRRKEMHKRWKNEAEALEHERQTMIWELCEAHRKIIDLVRINETFIKYIEKQAGAKHLQGTQFVRWHDTRPFTDFYIDAKGNAVDVQYAINEADLPPGA